MIITTQQFNEFFDKINQLYFENKLPRIKYKIANSKCYFGRFVAKNANDYYISMSSVLLNTIKDFENTLAHEMIHYYIWYFKIKDSSSHGYVFQDFMRKINSYGLHKITISSKSQRPENKEGFEIKHGFLCKTKDNPTHIFVFFINKNKINEYKKRLEFSVKSKSWCLEYKYFTSNNNFFKFSTECTKSIRGTYLTASKLNELGINYDKPNTSQIIDLDDML